MLKVVVILMTTTLINVLSQLITADISKNIYYIL